MMKNKLKHTGRSPALLASALALAALTGCATGPDANPQDPLEPFNRGVYRFNDAVDTAVLKPVATVYKDVTPSPVQTGVNNFFSNLGDLWSAANAGLQLRPREATENLMRFSVNTVFGPRCDASAVTSMSEKRYRIGSISRRKSRNPWRISHQAVITQMAPKAAKPSGQTTRWLRSPGSE